MNSPLSRATLDNLRRLADLPFGSRPEHPEILVALLDEIERLQREVDRLRRSVG